VGQPQSAEPLGADRLNGGVEPQVVVVEAVPIEEGQDLVEDARPVF
jgi:hypothetical protein